MEAGADLSKTVSKAGWRKIQFCAKQAAADGLRYFWIDTCCIDKRNAVELSAAINSMFRWYQNAARCYVYLSDVSKLAGADSDKEWKNALETCRWFTQGWTLQELIAPRLVDFFSSEGERLGSKLLLVSEIHEITGIATKALRGDALSSFSIKERRSWAERRNTMIERGWGVLFDWSLWGLHVTKLWRGKGPYIPAAGGRDSQFKRRWVDLCLDLLVEAMN
jgi:hypothetical protein